MVLTEKDLSEYQHLCAEIEDLSKRISKERNEELLRLYREQKERSECKKVEIEKAIERISKPDVRAIFRHRYLDGMSLEEVGWKVGYSKSSISIILSKNMPIE